jgi:hypothetical protein
MGVFPYHAKERVVPVRRFNASVVRELFQRRVKVIHRGFGLVRLGDEGVQDLEGGRSSGPVVSGWKPPSAQQLLFRMPCRNALLAIACIHGNCVYTVCMEDNKVGVEGDGLQAALGGRMPQLDA